MACMYSIKSKTVWKGKNMSSVFIAVIVMWVLSIVAAPIVRYIGISMYGKDGDMLWLAYLLYAITIGSVYSFLIYVLCTLLLKL